MLCYTCCLSSGICLIYKSSVYFWSWVWSQGKKHILSILDRFKRLFVAASCHWPHSSWHAIRLLLSSSPSLRWFFYSMPLVRFFGSVMTITFVPPSCHFLVVVWSCCERYFQVLRSSFWSWCIFGTIVMVIFVCHWELLKYVGHFKAFGTSSRSCCNGYFHASR